MAKAILEIAQAQYAAEVKPSTRYRMMRSDDASDDASDAEHDDSNDGDLRPGQRVRGKAPRQETPCELERGQRGRSPHWYRLIRVKGTRGRGVGRAGRHAA